MLTRRTAICTLLATPFLAGSARAGRSVIYAVDGWAINGVDPVAYFRDGAVVAGKRSEAVRWRGARWCFKTARNREAFERNPHAFAPRYGGHCALAMTRGELSPSDPEAWAILDGDLFMNASVAGRTVWMADPETYIRAADAHWMRLLHG